VPPDVAAWLGLSSMVVVVLGGCIRCLLYARRLSSQQDFVSDCIVGGKKIVLSIDGNGDGQIHASEKIVCDLDKRTLQVVATGEVSPVPPPIETRPLPRRRNTPPQDGKAAACAGVETFAA
jgi:hypothetical protein